MQPVSTSAETGKDYLSEWVSVHVTVVVDILSVDIYCFTRHCMLFLALLLTVTN
jgi:hypothetical protein